MRPLRLLRRTAPALLVLAVAVLASLSAWSDPVRWEDGDAINYQAKALSFRGEDEGAALRRLFAGPLAAGLVRSEASLPPSRQHFTNPRLIDYGRRYFERRVVVPLMAAALHPVAGYRSLLYVSLAGYLLLGLALFALLRLRFSGAISALVASACLLATPLREHSFVPMTDSWGVLLETCALVAAVLAMDRGLRWLIAWVAAIAVLSFTRDVTIVPVVAAGLLALALRERRSLWLAASGVAAAAPAPLILQGASVRENMAFVFSGFYPPRDDSVGFIARHYWPNLEELLRADLTYGTDRGWPTLLWLLILVVLAAAVVALVAGSSRGGDPYFRLMRYALVGAAVYLALFAFPSGLRLELVFLPPVAAGLALLAERAQSEARAALKRPRTSTSSGSTPRSTAR